MDIAFNVIIRFAGLVQAEETVAELVVKDKATKLAKAEAMQLVDSETEGHVFILDSTDDEVHEEWEVEEGQAILKFSKLI